MTWVNQIKKKNIWEQEAKDCESHRTVSLPELEPIKRTMNRKCSTAQPEVAVRELYLTIPRIQSTSWACDRLQSWNRICWLCFTHSQPLANGPAPSRLLSAPGKFRVTTQDGEGQFLFPLLLSCSPSVQLESLSLCLAERITPPSNPACLSCKIFFR